MAGGDGSLPSWRRPPLRTGCPFICIPAGTRNHFAGDLGVDRRDPVGALDAFSDGLEGRIDLGDVNGRLFLNNVSLGIYGEAVRTPAYREAKVRTLVETAEQVLGPQRADAGAEPRRRRGARARHPLILIVSNNPYALDRPPARGGTPVPRQRTARDRRSRRTEPKAARAGASLDGGRPGGERCRTVHAGIDGEAVDISPLRFAIRPAALRVRLPADHPGRPPAPEHLA